MQIVTQEEWVEQQQSLESLQTAFENGVQHSANFDLLLLESKYDEALDCFVR